MLPTITELRHRTLNKSTYMRVQQDFENFSKEVWFRILYTVKWGNTIIGINIVTSLPKFLTGYYSRTNELISLA